VDCLAIADCRRPDGDGLGLAQAGVELDAHGKVRVDAYGQTTNPKVYAIGDLVNDKALAHNASEEGVVAAERASGVPTHPLDHGLMVGATFCAPQVASVGLTEQAAREAGHEVRIGKQKIAGEGELARIVHPHPTISEAVLDAARAVDGWAVHA
jgi:dihydrolipoamide dehydrogenase